MTRTRRHPNSPNQEERRTYRRRVGGLFAAYLAVIGIAVVVTYLRIPASAPGGPTQMARLRPAAWPVAIPSVVLSTQP